MVSLVVFPSGKTLLYVFLIRHYLSPVWRGACRYLAGAGLTLEAPGDVGCRPKAVDA